MNVLYDVKNNVLHAAGPDPAAHDGGEVLREEEE